MTADGGRVSDASVDSPMQDPSDRSLGELVGQITKDLGLLVRQEVDLAKAEMRVEAKKAGKAGAMAGGAGVAGLMVAIFGSLAAVFGLDAWMPRGWAALIVAAVWAIVGAVLWAQARNRLKSIDLVPERTVETVKEDVQWATNRSS